eukprot:CAMPEP_0174735100 /NCGR_PEP_ID=MMETSP1094-20130205/64377_1 /TAXON_ID=156173 /ORGANISM="Chrysochromulina brevifilum, Strain UTEX LB 985" /LENGTH=52 /DNA_ID=CAMNT_0015938021 /DNA_START=120 /DNA_END=278 /DNA_ORIENTATION=-
MRVADAKVRDGACGLRRQQAGERRLYSKREIERATGSLVATVTLHDNNAPLA